MFFFFLWHMWTTEGGFQYVFFLELFLNLLNIVRIIQMIQVLGVNIIYIYEV